MPNKNRKQDKFVRIYPEIEEQLIKASELENRTVTNFVNNLIEKYCKENSVNV